MVCQNAQIVTSFETGFLRKYVIQVPGYLYCYKMYRYANIKVVLLCIHTGIGIVVDVGTILYTGLMYINMYVYHIRVLDLYSPFLSKVMFMSYCIS